MLLGDVKVEDVVVFLLIFFLTFFGSITKDYLRIMQYNTGKFSYYRIILSTIFASLVGFAFSDLAIIYTGIRGLMLISFILGLVGFKLLESLSDLRNITSLIKYILDYLKYLLEFYYKVIRKN